MMRRGDNNVGLMSRPLLPMGLLEERTRPGMRKSRNEVPATELASPCPYCGGDQFIGAGRGRALCVSCRRCWVIEGDVVRWVSPARCDGCILDGVCQSQVEIEGRMPVLCAPVRRRLRAVPSRLPVGPRPRPATAPLPPP